MSCFIYIASLAGQMNFCRDKEIEYRMQYIEYLNNRSAKCYKLGASGENGCYDCTGMIFAHFKTRPRSYKDSTKYYNIEAKHTKLEDMQTGDLVLFLERQEGQGTHTATFIKAIDKNNIEILDSYENWTYNTKRIIPIVGNYHTIKLVKNPYIK